MHFRLRSGELLGSSKTVRAVDGVSFEVAGGTTFAIVGESGSGKTTLSRAILGLYEPTKGTVLYDGRDIAGLRSAGKQDYRRNAQAVFQDPWASLNPRLRVGAIIQDPLAAQSSGDKSSRRERVSELLDLVGLESDYARRYPHELSGGQRQRVAVARALALDPRLIVLDEPVSSLDVSIAAQIMNLLKDLQERLGLTYLLIAHDLGVVRNMADAVGVMYLGRFVEQGAADKVLKVTASDRSHPYTQGLLAAVLEVRPAADAFDRPLIGGEIPSAVSPPPGCHFHPRCPYVMEVCRTVFPSMNPLGDGRSAACHLLSPTAQVVAPKRSGLDMADRDVSPRPVDVAAPRARVKSRPRPTGHALLEVRGLVTTIRTRWGLIRAVDGVDLTLRSGEMLGLVGESGSGKTMTALSVVRVLPVGTQVEAGEVLFRQEDLLRLSEKEMRSRIRANEIAMILQDPLSSLNPVLTVGNQLAETIRANLRLPKGERERLGITLLEQVRLPDAAQRLRSYPHELSGGMRQRVGGAISLAGAPSLLIADEPTTSLDPTIQAQYLALLKSLQAETGMAILLITHNLGIVANVCDQVAIMYAGRIVESGPVDHVLSNPQHPYTKGLLRSVPRLAGQGRLASIRGQPPTHSGQSIDGCKFAPRCDHAWERCREYPPVFSVGDGQEAACWLLEREATHVD